MAFFLRVFVSLCLLQSCYNNNGKDIVSFRARLSPQVGLWQECEGAWVGACSVSIVSFLSMKHKPPQPSGRSARSLELMWNGIRELAQGLSYQKTWANISGDSMLSLCSKIHSGPCEQTLSHMPHQWGNILNSDVVCWREPLFAITKPCFQLCAPFVAEGRIVLFVHNA